MRMSDDGLERGPAELQSVGPIAFGPGDVLFVGDNAAASILAIDVGAGSGADVGPADAFDLDDLDGKLAALLGCPTDDVVIRDMAVHPRAHDVYLSVTRGTGADAIPLVVRVDHADGTLVDLDLSDVRHARVSIANAPSVDDERVDVELPDPPEGEEIEIGGATIRLARHPARASTITDIAYVDGTVLVAGMSNEEFASNLRRIPFPFTGEMVDDSLEIFHVSHGKWETAAPIRTFLPFDGGKSLLASYTCTPLVHFTLDDLAAGAKVVGRTVAELGARNQPQDIVAFRQGDEDWLLVCHSAHPLMKIRCADISTQGALTEPHEPVGVPREEIDIPGVRRLDNLNGDYVLALVRDTEGHRHLRSLKVASL
jgi:hypothetical protein